MIEGTHLEHWINNITIGTWLPNDENGDGVVITKKKVYRKKAKSTRRRGGPERSSKTTTTDQLKT